MPDSGPRDLPLFPLNVVLYPGMSLPLRVFEERYKQMMNKCLEGDMTFGVVLIKSGKEVGGGAVPFEIGTVARIMDVVPQGGGRMLVSAVGEEVFRIVDIQQITPYMVGSVEVLERTEESAPEELTTRVVGHFKTYRSLLASLRGLGEGTVDLDDDPERLSYTVAAELMTGTREKQGLLETSSATVRLEEELKLLQSTNLSLELFLSERRKKEARGSRKDDSSERPRFSLN